MYLLKGRLFPVIFTGKLSSTKPLSFLLSIVSIFLEKKITSKFFRYKLLKETSKKRSYNTPTCSSPGFIYIHKSINMHS